MIPITKPVFDETDLAIIQEPLKSGWVVQGPYVKQFEDLFSRFTGAAHSIATTSCTTALHIAMAALGVKPGDEVLVPAFTWVATANCVEYLGAKPVFVDIDLETFNIDIHKIEEKVTPRTRGIIPVHLFGLAADMEAIGTIARKHGLFVVEDAACGFDTWFQQRHVGTFGDFGCFSFHPRKAITTGEGGMITTQDPAQDELCRSLRDHGASRSDMQRHKQKYSFLLAEYRHLGYNFRMTDIQGALGVSQMMKAKKIMAERRKTAHAYDRRLKEMWWIQRPWRHKDYIHGYQSYVCLFRPEDASLKNWKKIFMRRNKIMAILEKEGIMTRQGTHAAALAGYYADKYSFRPENYPNAFLAEKLTISLPLYFGMNPSDVNFIGTALDRAFKSL
jgi:dTDP-4-amino-4,6-dideoxygalactose transaminase